MKPLLSFLALLLGSAFSLSAQTFPGTGGTIPDDGLTAGNFNLTVSGMSPAALNATHGLKSVCINITHGYVGDLDIVLRAPDGTEVTLASGLGGSGNNFTNTCFDQSASNSISSGNPPFTGSYKPASNLGTINNGQSGNGQWTLRIFDDSPTDQGTLVSWSLTFANNATVTAPFSSSNLPIVIINTAGQPIVDDPKRTADMGIIYNGPGNLNHTTDPKNNYNGKIGIELRGSSSQSFPKKPYGFETRTAAGDDSDVALLGMPAQSDWILYASYSDKSLINNVLAYRLYRDWGMYAPRTAYVELVLNGQYKGVYVLIEKIKRDINRVDISKMTTTDTVGANVTGGYIIKVDKTTGAGGSGWTSQFLPPVHNANQTIKFQYEYPKEDVIVPKQKAYIKSFVDSFENALNSKPLYDTTIGWRHFAAESSFLRYFLLSEVSKNVDGYRISTFLYKTKSTKGGKLFVGPPWDYDLAFHNADYCNGNVDTGWAYNFGVYSCNTDGNQVPFWWKKLATQDTIFQNKLRCMYDSMRVATLDTVRMFTYIDSLANYLNAAQQRNFTAWPTLGKYVWPNPSPIPTTYAGEIRELKDYLKRRLAWLDAHLPGTCRPAPPTPNAVAALSGGNSYRIYPNPFDGRLNVEVNAAKSGTMELSLSTTDGRLVQRRTLSIQPGRNEVSVDNAASLPAGMYLMTIRCEGQSQTFKVTKQ